MKTKQSKSKHTIPNLIKDTRIERSSHHVTVVDCNESWLLANLTCTCIIVIVTVVVAVVVAAAAFVVVIHVVVVVIIAIVVIVVLVAPI